MMLNDIQAFENAETAAKSVLQLLHDRIGLGLWMVTRTLGDSWIVLNIQDEIYNIQEGAVFNWSDSFCCRMIKGVGPRIAPNSSQIPAYLAAPIAQQVSIGAYVGVPLMQTNGVLFGTLCAIDPQPQPEGIVQELPLVELCARLLMTILESDMQKMTAQRRAERAEQESLIDSLTQLYNRRAWDKLLMQEEIRCARFGHPAAVFVIDLDELKVVNDAQGHSAGDKLIQKTADILRHVVREQDIIARIGGDEFVVMILETDELAAEEVFRRLEENFAKDQVRASIGYDIRHPTHGIIHAWNHADRKMYANKLKRKQQLQPNSASLP
jgi:diguanylate cyclase (GGDEF)-like protein